MFPGFCLMCCDKGDRKEQYSTVASIILPLCIQSLVRKENHYFVSQKHTSTLKRAIAGNRDIWCWISPYLQWDAWINVFWSWKTALWPITLRYLKWNSRTLFWKRIGDVLWAHCLYLDVIWTQKKAGLNVWILFFHGRKLQVLGGQASSHIHCILAGSGSKGNILSCLRVR